MPRVTGIIPRCVVRLTCWLGASVVNVLVNCSSSVIGTWLMAVITSPACSPCRVAGAPGVSSVMLSPFT